MTIIPNTRWPDTDTPHEPKIRSTERLLLLKLSEHRTAMLNLSRIEAEIADLSRAWADDRGEFMLPGIQRLRRELGAA